jgi:hypothetical protein
VVCSTWLCAGKLMSTLHTEIQAFTLSGRPMEQGGRGSWRASGKTQRIGKKRTEPKAEHDALDEGVVMDEQGPVVPCLGDEAGANVRCLVQKDLADQPRRRNTEVCRFPAAMDFFRMSVDGEDADLAWSVSEEGGQACGVDSFAQWESHGNPREAKTEGDVVVDALQLELRRGPCKAQRNVVFQGAAHRTNAPSSGAEVDDHEGIPRVGGELDGKRAELVLVVCAERPAVPVPMNRVHISRRACARVITRARAREGAGSPLPDFDGMGRRGGLWREPEAQP